TLGGIAQRIRGQSAYRGASMYQVLAALLQANPAAFIDGNMNRVRAGAQLRVPDADAVSAVDAADARRLYALHMEQCAAYRSRVARGAGPVSGFTARAESSGAVAAAPPAAPLPSGRDTLRLSSAAPASDVPQASQGQAAAAAARQAEIDRLMDERAATMRALAEAESRVSELEDSLAAMQRLLSMQNETLARLQQGAAERADQTGGA